MKKRLDIKAGDRFGKLTVIREVEPNVTPSGAIQRKYLCHCDCGNYIIRTKTTLNNTTHNIYNALRGTRGIKNSGGFVWRYKENEL